MRIRGITIAVGEWYARTLEICLCRNMRHLEECLVVTAPGEEKVKEVVRRVPGARIFETDAFTREGANGVKPRFNKGLGMHEGLLELGRQGWIWIWDADCLFPDHVPLEQIQFGRLHGAHRRMLEDPRKWRPGFDWNLCPRARDGAPVGYTQIFHADDPVLLGQHIWYDVTFTHAGGGDAAFLRHWSRNNHFMLPMDVLHLGPRDQNWFGATPEGREIMDAFVVRNGWTRRRPMVDRGAAERVGEIVDRVEVPGYPPSTFELPFVARSKAPKP